MISIKFVQIKNPLEKTEEGKYYPKVINQNEVNSMELANLISSKCTVTRTDCLAVISALQEEMVNALLNGSRVVMDMLGSFKLTCKGTGVANFDDCTVKQIKSLNIRFLPSSLSKSSFKVGLYNVKFNNINKTVAEENAKAAEEKTNAAEE